VPHPEVARLMAAADAFVLASFNEGHPKVLLEAMAAGAPCVASDCEGNRSLVADGRTGLLFDPYKPEDLAAQLDRALGDTGLAAGLATAARQQVTASYDLGALVTEEIALLKRVARPN
jgi:glycosyltransferase involved in cell wall biosynthesis